LGDRATQPGPWEPPQNKRSVWLAPHCPTMTALLIGYVRRVRALFAPCPRGAARHQPDRLFCGGSLVRVGKGSFGVLPGRRPLAATKRLERPSLRFNLRAGTHAQAPEDGHGGAPALEGM